MPPQTRSRPRLSPKAPQRSLCVVRGLQGWGSQSRSGPANDPPERPRWQHTGRSTFSSTTLNHQHQANACQNEQRAGLGHPSANLTHRPGAPSGGSILTILERFSVPCSTPVPGPSSLVRGPPWRAHQGPRATDGPGTRGPSTKDLTATPNWKTL